MVIIVVLLLAFIVVRSYITRASRERKVSMQINNGCFIKVPSDCLIINRALVKEYWVPAISPRENFSRVSCGTKSAVHDRISSSQYFFGMRAFAYMLIKR